MIAAMGAVSGLREPAEWIHLALADVCVALTGLGGATIDRNQVLESWGFDPAQRPNMTPEQEMEWMRNVGRNPS